MKPGSFATRTATPPLAGFASSPEMVKRRARERKLAIWKCGLLSGQEPYSIAMALCEQFNLPRLELFHPGDRFFHHDSGARQDQTITVRNGSEPRTAGDFLTRYFKQQGLHWQLKPEILAMVRLQFLNLAEPWNNAYLRLTSFCCAMFSFTSTWKPGRRFWVDSDGCTTGRFSVPGLRGNNPDLDAGFEVVQAENYVCYRLKDR